MFSGQHSSPRKSGASDLRLTDASFDSSSLAAKFKAGLMQAQGQGGSSQVHAYTLLSLKIFRNQN